MKRRFLTLSCVLVVAGTFATGAAAPQGIRDRSLAAASPATLVAPSEGESVTTMGPSLAWESPAGATQYHLQVVPANNDGPGINLQVGSPDTSFSIPPPPDWYGLLPDVTYTWRVRVSDAPMFVSLDHPSWSAWAERRFRTPKAGSDTISLISPPGATTVGSLTPVLQWENSRRDIFYYEVQVSKDQSFNTDPATATAMVYWELIHGGVAEPNNAYRVPAAFPLQNNTVYHWRVRPRIQGDGTPVAWSPASSFMTQQSAATVTPTPTPTATATPTATPTPSVPPAYSGERIAFVSFRAGAAEIWAVRADGSGLVNLSRSPGTDDRPVWSKDGKKLAFVSDRDGNREVYIMNANGSNQVRVTNHTALDDDPNWSPDGNRLVFISRRDGPQQIYRVNEDGTGVTRLTSTTAANWQPQWSPDGSKVLYGSVRNGDLELFLSEPDGSGEVALVKNPAQEFGHGWAPDGKRIVFQSSRDGNFEIYSMNSDGNNQKNLTNHAASDVSAVWSPDGKKIAFVSDRDGNLEVYVMNADGTGQMNLSNNAGEDCHPSDCLPAWSPDSTRLAFVSKRDGNKEVYVARADGTGLTRITNDSSDDVRPVWTQ